MPKAEWLRRLARYRGRWRRISSPPRARREAVIRRWRLALSSGRRRRAGQWPSLCAHPCLRRRLPGGAAGGDTTGKGTALSPAGDGAADCVPAGGPASLAPAFAASVEADGVDGRLRDESGASVSVDVTRPPAGQSPELSAYRCSRPRPATEARSRPWVMDLPAGRRQEQAVASTVMAADADGPAGGAAGASVAARDAGLDDGDSDVAPPVDSQPRRRLS